jgi:hypothetical protein
MQVVQILPVDEQVEHIVTLANDLETGLDPVECSLLEELGVLQRPEQVALSHCLRRFVVDGVKDVDFQLRGVSLHKAGHDSWQLTSFWYDTLVLTA